MRDDAEVGISASETRTFSGRYIRGHEVSEFTPCDSPASFWVRSSIDVNSELADFYESNTSEPYEAIFIEFDGRMLNETPDGFAASYDGVIHIDRIRDQTSEVPGDCSG